LTKNAVHEQFQVLQMPSEAPVCADIPSAKDYGTSFEGSDVEAITKYLSRPVCVNSSTVPATAGNIWQYAFDTAVSFQQLMDVGGFSNWERTQGLYGLKATLVFTVNVSASAFNQGILALSFQYGAGTASGNYIRSSFLPYTLHLPHVRLNIASGTSMTLRVPWVSDDACIPVDGDTSFGNYGVVCLTSLVSSPVVVGQSPATVQVHFHLEDLELIGAQPFSYTSISLQAGEHGSSAAPADNTAVPTSGGVASAVHTEGVQEGVVSTPLAAIATLGRAAARVPSLAAIGGAVDWYASYLARTARSLGFSKPIDETVPTRVNRYGYAGDTQYDLASTAFSLSGSQANKLAVDGSVGCYDTNEMDFDHILSIPSYVYQGSFTSSNGVGDVIYGTPMCPTAFWFRSYFFGASTPRSNKPLKVSNALTENAFLPSTLCYVADNFQQWRGGFKFKFSFGKTKLHGGRLLVTFIPRTVKQSNTATPISSLTLIPGSVAGVVNTTGHSAIFDLRDAEEFEFDVPWMSTSPYLSVFESFGDLSMTVIAPLRTVASVPATVDFMVEVSALPNFEFAVPTASLMSPVPAQGATAITYQSGVSLVENAVDLSQHAVGEKITSVKQLIMMSDYFAWDLTGPTVGRNTLDPWWKTNTLPLATPMGTTGTALFFASRSSRMAAMYSFARGGTMFSVLREPGAARSTLSWRLHPDRTATTVASLGSFYSKELSRYGAVYIPENQEAGRVKVAPYARYTRLQVGNGFLLGGDTRASPGVVTWNPNQSVYPAVLAIRNNDAGLRRYIVGRSAADDGMLGRFIGPPVCIVLNNLATVNPVFGNTDNEF